VRRDFWPKLKHHAARLPFAEDLVAEHRDAARRLLARAGRSDYRPE
jgi:hypothetical protein